VGRVTAALSYVYNASGYLFTSLSMAAVHLVVFVVIAAISIVRRLKNGGNDIAGLAWDDVLVAAVVTAALSYVYNLETIRGV
jgi:hypothetical protein